MSTLLLCAEGCCRASCIYLWIKVSFVLGAVYPTQGARLHPRSCIQGSGIDACAEIACAEWRHELSSVPRGVPVRDALARPADDGRRPRPRRPLKGTKRGRAHPGRRTVQGGHDPAGTPSQSPRGCPVSPAPLPSQIPTPRQASPEPNIPQGNLNLVHPCPHCLPGNQFGWTCPHPIADPDADLDAAWHTDDGAPPGHGYCGNW